MGRFSLAERVSDLLSHMANKLKKEGDRACTNSFRSPDKSGDPNCSTCYATLHRTHNLTCSLSHGRSYHNSDNRGIEEVEGYTEAQKDAGENSRVEGEELEEGEDEEVEGNVVAEEEDQEIEEGESRKEPTEKNTAEKKKEIVVVEEGESEEDDETLDERAARRNLRTQRRLETEETEVTASVADAKREAAERKRKGKQIATSSKKRQLRE